MSLPGLPTPLVRRFLRSRVLRTSRIFTPTSEIPFAGHPNVGVCWNSNETDIVNGSLKESFDLLKKHIRNCHINELSSGYPYRELFALLQQNKYERYTLCEAQESKEPERYLRNYRALWTELKRKCV